MRVLSKDDYRKAMGDWLRDRRHTHFVTLMANDPMASHDRMVRLLKDWDARVNRRIAGPKWRKRPDERMQWIAVLEKPGNSPHWHLLCYPSAEQLLWENWRECLTPYERDFIEIWEKLIASGTCDVQRIYDDGIVDYFTKTLGDPDRLEYTYNAMLLIRN